MASKGLPLSKPMIRSSNPSPLTSPALLTGWPKRLVGAGEGETVTAVQGRNIQARVEAAGLSEHHEGLLPVKGSDDDVAEAVAVDVAGIAHRPAEPIAGIDAVDGEARRTVQRR